VIMKLNIIIRVVLILFNFILKIINLNKDIFLICFTYTMYNKKNGGDKKLYFSASIKNN